MTNISVVLGLVWSPGCHDKHLGGQFWDLSGHQGAMTNISAVSSGTGLDIRVPRQTSRGSVLGLVWTPKHHDKHLSSHFWDWSGHQGTMSDDKHLSGQFWDWSCHQSTMTNISAVISGTGHQGAMMNISAASPSISLVSLVPQPSSQQSGTLGFLKLLVTVALPTSLSASLSLTSK